MTLQGKDPFWTETVDFILRVIGPGEAFVGPWEFRAVLPKVFNYDWVHGIHVVSDFAAVVVHKGLLQDLPLPVLQTMKAEWKCVYANAVFLVYMPAACPLPLAGAEHLGSFYEALLLLEKQAAYNGNPAREKTAFVVAASNIPSSLDATLESLSLFRVPILVIPFNTDAANRDALGDICRRYETRFEAEQNSATASEAVESGVRRLLEDDGFDWISSFDDTVITCPDFLSVMEKFRDAETCPVLGGCWNEEDGMRTQFLRDGISIITPRRRNSLILHGHRGYWERRFSRDHSRGSFSSHAQEARAIVIPNLIIPALAVGRAVSRSLT